MQRTAVVAIALVAVVGFATVGLVALPGTEPADAHGDHGSDSTDPSAHPTDSAKNNDNGGDAGPPSRAGDSSERNSDDGIGSDPPTHAESTDRHDQGRAAGIDLRLDPFPGLGVSAVGSFVRIATATGYKARAAGSGPDGYDQLGNITGTPTPSPTPEPTPTETPEPTPTETPEPTPTETPEPTPTETPMPGAGGPGITDGSIEVLDADVTADWVRAGHEATIRVTVENTDDEATTEGLQVTLDGEPIAEPDVSLDGGETDTVGLHVALEEGGTLAVEGVEAGEVAVADGDRWTPPEAPQAEPGAAPNPQPGFGATAGLLAALLATLGAWYRSKRQ